jgi:hypothetical protein
MMDSNYEHFYRLYFLGGKRLKVNRRGKELDVRVFSEIGDYFFSFTLFHTGRIKYKGPAV